MNVTKILKCAMPNEIKQAFSGVLCRTVDYYRVLKYNLMTHIRSLFFFSPRAAPEACGSSQARGQTGTTAAGLHHSHSNREPELLLQTT